MAGSDFAAGFGIDISNLKAGLAAANRLIKESEAQFKSAAAGMDDWSNSQQGLEKRVESLNKIVEIQGAKVNALKQEKERIIATMQAEGKSNEEIARAVDKVNGQIIKESNALDKNKAALDKAQSALDKFNAEQKAAADAADDNRTASERLTDTIDDQQKELEQLKAKYSDVALEQGSNSREAKDLAKEIKKLSGELADNKGKLADVEKRADEAAGELDDLGDSAESSGDGFTVAKGAIAGFISNGLTALVGAVKNAVSSVAGLADETREFRDQMSKLDAAAVNNGYTTDYAAAQFERFYKVLADDTASTTTVSNLMATGASMEDLNRIAYSMIGVWGQYGDSIPLDGLAESINETAKVGQITGNLADALNWAGINEDEFNEKLAKCTTEQERQHLIAMTLQEQYEGLADSYLENNDSVTKANEANLDLNKTLADIGEKAEPITTTIKSGFTGILQSVLDMVSGINPDEIAGKIDGAFTTFKDEILPKIMDGLSWIKENKDTIISAIAGMGAAFAVFKTASLISGVVKGIKAFQKANEGATIAQALLNTVMNMNPMAALITTIVAVVAAVVAFIATNEDARKKIVEIWNKVKDAFISFGEKIKEIFEKVKEFFISFGEKSKEIFENLKSEIMEKFKAVKDFFARLWSGIKDAAAAALESIKTAWGAVTGWFNDKIIQPIKNAFQAVVDFIKNLWIVKFIQESVEIVKVLLSGLWEIIKAIFSNVAEWFLQNVIAPVKNFFVELWNGIKDLAAAAWDGIKSIWAAVSGWFNNSVVVPVKNFFVGLWNGIKDLAAAAWSGIKSIWAAVSGWFNNSVVAPVKNFFSEMWSKVKNGASDAWAGIKNTFSKVATFFREIFGKAWNGVKDIFSTGGTVFEGIKDGIESTFKRIVNALIRGINRVVAVPFNAINKALDKVRNTSVAGITPFTSLPSVTVPQIPELATGGIVRKATNAIIGEAGTEAILPLENNTEWMDLLADKLASKMPKSAPTVYQTNNYSQAHSRYELYKTKQQTLAAMRLALKGV